VQLMRTWSFPKQLKHRPTRCSGTGRALCVGDARRHRLLLLTVRNPSASGSAFMRAGWPTKDLNLTCAARTRRGTSLRAARTGRGGCSLRAAAMKPEGWARGRLLRR